MNLRTALAFVVLASISLPALASSNSNDFTLVGNQSGKTVGKASYSIQQSSKGYKLSGHFQYSMSSSEQGQYDISYKLDSTGNFLSGSIQDQTAQKTYSFQPNKKRNSIEVSTIQAGSMGNPTTANLPQPYFFLVSIGDPSAIQALMDGVKANPLPKPIYMLLIPLSALSQQNKYRLISVQPGADRTGTLDGKTVALKSFTMRFHTGDASEIYLDASGKLMEADIPKFELNYIRKNFTLTPAAQ